MDKLTMADMNSLNAIAGYLKNRGDSGAAAVLHQIQCKATKLLTDDSDVKYIKTVNVTNTKNVLVQIPAWVAKLWGLTIGDKLEVQYDQDKNKVCISPSINEDIQR